MKEEILKILKMVEEGKLSKDEAVELIEALKETEKEETTLKRKRFVRIKVTKEGKPTVNITLPFSLVKWGLSLAQKIGHKKLTLEGKDIPLDLNELNEALSDPDFRGKIVDVTNEDGREHVEIEIV